MKIWLDDVRPAPDGYIWCHSVNEAKRLISKNPDSVTMVDLDHDLGDFAGDGGDGICLLDFLVEKNLFYKISLHTMNYVAMKNMIRILKRHSDNSNWSEWRCKC